MDEQIGGLEVDAFLGSGVADEDGARSLTVPSTDCFTVFVTRTCREVGGDLAIYFPPGDVAQLAAQVKRVLAGEAVERSRSEGPRHARRFDWPTVARRTAEVYRELLAERTRRSG